MKSFNNLFLNGFYVKNTLFRQLTVSLIYILSTGSIPWGIKFYPIIGNTLCDLISDKGRCIDSLV